MNDDFSKSAQQSIKFFENYIRKNNVIDFVKALREEVNIPQKGFKFTKEDRSILNIETDRFSYPMPFRNKINLLGSTYKESKKKGKKMYLVIGNFLSKKK